MIPEDRLFMLRQAVEKNFINADEIVSHLQKAQAEEQIPEKFGKFKIIRFLSSGGGGNVYLAEDTALKIQVALKILTRVELDDIERFYREARLLARLNHPNIVKIYEIGKIDKTHYISLQYIDGESVEHKALSLTRALEVILTVAKAVSYAHTIRIIHRDIKPSNILIDKEARVYLADFGVAKQVRLTRRETLSITGMVIGTPNYMSPEQARGELSQIDERTDIYSLGATLYYLVTGNEPYSGSTAFEIVNRVLNEDPVSPRKLNPAIPADVEAIIMKAMEKDRAHRYQDTGEFISDIQRYLSGEPVKAGTISTIRRVLRRVKKQWPRFVAAAFVSLIVVAAVIFYTELTKAKSTREIQKKVAELLSESNKYLSEFEKQRFLPASDITKKYYILDRAKDFARKALELDTKNSEAFYELSKINFSKGDYTEALNEVTKAIALKEDNRYFYQRGLIYKEIAGEKQQTTEPEALEEIMPELLALKEKITADFTRCLNASNLSSWELAYIQAVLSFYSGDEKKAFDLLENHLEKEDNASIKATLLHYKGIFYMYAGNFDGAIQAFDQAIDIKRCDEFLYSYCAQAHYQKARMLLLQGKDPADEFLHAVDNYDMALKVNPHFIHPYNAAGLVYYNYAKYHMLRNINPSAEVSRAIQYYRNGLRINPQEPVFYLNTGLSHLLLAEYKFQIKQDPLYEIEQATKAFDEAAKLKPDHFKAYHNLVAAYVEKLRYLHDKMPPEEIEAAINACKKSIELSPGKLKGGSYYNLYIIYIEKADIKASQGKDPSDDLDLARENAQKALDLDYIPEKCYCALGRIHLSRGKYYLNVLSDNERANEEFNRALEEFNKALSIRKTATTYSYRGMVYFYQKNYKQAIDNWQMAKKLEPILSNFLEPYINDAMEKLR